MALAAEKRKISIFGVTGSIGQSTADLVLSRPDKFDVAVVTANSNAIKLAEMAVNLGSAQAVIADKNQYNALKTALEGTDIKAEAGEEALLAAARIPVDWTMCAIVGLAGLPPLLQSLRHSKYVAIANKEPLVAAGPLVLDTAKRYNTTILPVDSEHNAIFQVFDHKNPQTIRNIILTASGGPFRTWSREDMEKATPEQAVAHPNWTMGAKISVDSASMMNKALEVIEAHYLFDMPPEKINVLIHPQSIIHSMVEYIDGSVLAQLGAPDMRTPIAHALAWPDRMETSGDRLDWKNMQRLDFEEIDHERFPSVRMAYDCLAKGLYATLAFNAANEVLVAAFLDKRIGFTDIIEYNNKMLGNLPQREISTLEDIIDMDHSVREEIQSYIR